MDVRHTEESGGGEEEWEQILHIQSNCSVQRRDSSNL
jgi:hypothetical protein